MPSTQNQRHYTAAEWSSYADKELPASQRLEMQSHLAECAECAALARSYDAVQRGAEELARRAAQPPTGLRTRLLAVGAAVLEREQTRWFWLTVIALGIFAATVVAGVWVSLRQAPHPIVPTRIVSSGVDSHSVLLSLDHVEIEHFPIPPTMMYEVTIENLSDKSLKIMYVKVRDPINKFERLFDPPVIVSPRTRLTRHAFATYPLNDEDELRDGIYRIEITTNLGSFNAERVILSSEKR